MVQHGQAGPVPFVQGLHHSLDRLLVPAIVDHDDVQILPGLLKDVRQCPRKEYRAVLGPNDNGHGDRTAHVIHKFPSTMHS